MKEPVAWGVGTKIKPEMPQGLQALITTAPIKSSLDGNQKRHDSAGRRRAGGCVRRRLVDVDEGGRCCAAAAAGHMRNVATPPRSCQNGRSERVQVMKRRMFPFGFSQSGLLTNVTFSKVSLWEDLVKRFGTSRFFPAVLRHSASLPLASPVAAERALCLVFSEAWLSPPSSPAGHLKVSCPFSTAELFHYRSPCCATAKSKFLVWSVVALTASSRQLQENLT